MGAAIGDALVNLAVALIRAAPERPKLWLTDVVARVLFAVWRSRRRAAIYWAARALGKPVASPETVATARRGMINFCRFTLDFVQSSTVPRRQLLDAKVRLTHHPEVVDQVVRRGSGCLFISGHVGNWELIGMSLAIIKGSLNVIALPLDAGSFNRFAERTRELNGFRVIESEGAVRRVLRLLKEGEWVAILGDRPVADRGELVDFLGRPGRHPLGMVRIANRARVPVVLGACWSDGRGGYEIDFIPLEGAEDPDAGGDELVARAARALEALVTRHPDQWYIAYTSGPGIDGIPA